MRSVKESVPSAHDETQENHDHEENSLGAGALRHTRLLICAVFCCSRRHSSLESAGGINTERKWVKQMRMVFLFLNLALALWLQPVQAISAASAFRQVD